MINLFLIAAIAALYVLGAYQGSTIADGIDEELATTNEELGPEGRFMLVWCWPVATVIAMVGASDGE